MRLIRVKANANLGALKPRNAVFPVLECKRLGNNVDADGGTL